MIIELYGFDQMQLARPSMNSVVDRRNFAQYHFHEAMDRWEQHLLDIKECDPIEVSLYLGDEETESLRQRRMKEFASHVQACVQSLHAIPDIMAHVIYYGLALNKVSPLEERKVSARNIMKLLANDYSLKQLEALFMSMSSDGDFVYLDALNNHGKHRSLVTTAVWFDNSGQAEEPITIKFSEFNYDGIQHFPRDIRPVLTDEYGRIARSIVDCGIELWTILGQRHKNGLT